MALLNKLKSILGIGGSRSGDERTDTSVTVEREASDTASGEESATPSNGDSDTGREDVDTGSDEEVTEKTTGPAAAGTDATASTESMTETETDETAAEPGEAAGSAPETPDDEPVDDDVEDVIDEAEDRHPEPDTGDKPEPPEQATDADVDEPAADDTEPGADQSTDDIGTDTDEADEKASQPVTAVKGIGPAYSERLEAAGITSVAALAEANVETLAEEIDVSPKIVGDWIDRAQDQ